MRGSRCLEEELHFPATHLKFLYEALAALHVYDQAACIFDALAWSFKQSRIFDAPSAFGAVNEGVTADMPRHVPTLRRRPPHGNL